MTKQQLDNYVNKVVEITYKSGNKINGRLRKIANVYIIGKDTQVMPSSVKEVRTNWCKNTGQKCIERKKVEEHIYYEVWQYVGNGKTFSHYRVRYGYMCGKKLNISKSFNTLQEAQDFKAICERNIGEYKFNKESVKQAFADKVEIDYPETLLNAIGINAEEHENFYNEIIPHFEENFEKVANDTLNERESDFIIRHYREKQTLEEIGKYCNRTRERIRQIIAKGLKKLGCKRAKTIFITDVHQYELINAKEREELYCKLKREMNYELAKEIIAQHEKELEEEAQRNQLTWKIEELDFSCRTYNCLKRAGINTIGELVKLDDFDLMKIRNLGKKCMKEIKTKLEDNGFKRVGEYE